MQAATAAAPLFIYANSDRVESCNMAQLVSAFFILSKGWRAERIIAALELDYPRQYGSFENADGRRHEWQLTLCDMAHSLAMVRRLVAPTQINPFINQNPNIDQSINRSKSN